MRFHLGRTRIGQRELEWRSEWDGAWMWMRWRELRVTTPKAMIGRCKK